MLMIRLKRIGRKNDPSFRVVVTEKHRGPKSGKYIENLGLYDPRKDDNEIDGERAKYWIDNGAQPSGTVHNLLVSQGVIDAPKRNVLPKGSPIVSESEESDDGVKESTAPADTSSTTADTDAVDEDTTEETSEEAPVKEEAKESKEPEPPTEEKKESEEPETSDEENSSSEDEPQESTDKDAGNADDESSEEQVEESTSSEDEAQIKTDTNAGQANNDSNEKES